METELFEYFVKYDISVGGTVKCKEKYDEITRIL